MKNNYKGEAAINFDFNAWAELAKKDPELFNQKRKQAVSELIEKAPLNMQNRLRGLQWRVDLEIQRSNNPMDACLRIYRMMMDSVYSPGGLLETLNNLHEYDKIASYNINNNNAVVQFPVNPTLS